MNMFTLIQNTTEKVYWAKHYFKNKYSFKYKNLVKPPRRKISAYVTATAVKAISLKIAS